MIKITLQNNPINLFIWKPFSCKYMTVFAKINLMGTNTEIHFLPVNESHTHALFRDTKHLRLDGHVCFLQTAFF